MRRLPSLLLASLVASGASAATWRVTNPGDSGPGTLRWAIEQAVANPGSDKIKFAARMSGQVIQPLTALPTAYGPYTVIDGDIDDDGAPDVALNGRRVAGMAAGLRVQGLGCTIIGLAIGGFPNSGMIIADAYECTIRSCHLGVNLAGTKENLNTYYQLLVVRSGKNRIGGTSPGEGNVIAAGPNHDQCGIRLCDSSDNTVTGNYIGVARDGGSALGANGIGIQVDPGAGESTGNTIGGTTASKRNVFGGLGTGVEVSLAEDNLIAGNYFGLAADGDTVLPITAAGVKLDACRRNTVGGTAAGARDGKRRRQPGPRQLLRPERIRRCTAAPPAGNLHQHHRRPADHRRLYHRTRQLLLPAHTIGIHLGSVAVRRLWLCDPQQQLRHPA
jgi:hypothetical protein